MIQGKLFCMCADGHKDARRKLSVQMPLIEICGRKRILFENHIGILGYDPREIVVKVCLGHIYVQGRELTVRKISKEKLVISGVIDSVRFQGRE